MITIKRRHPAGLRGRSPKTRTLLTIVLAAAALSTSAHAISEASGIHGASANICELWQPDGRMESVLIDYDVESAAGPAVCGLNVSSDESDGGPESDWVVVNGHEVLLRAERNEDGDGRVYTVTITCTDPAGVVSAETVSVGVPKTRGNW